jgi:hypothetical protein
MRTGIVDSAAVTCTSVDLVLTVSFIILNAYTLQPQMLRLCALFLISSLKTLKKKLIIAATNTAKTLADRKAGEQLL